MNKPCIAFAMASLLLPLGTANAIDYKLRHDPFARAVVVNQGNSNTSTLELKLRAVILDEDNSIANINGKFVGLNQSFSGYTITSIERNKVVLERNGNTTILKTTSYEQSDR